MNFPVAGITAGVVIFAPCIINVLFHVVSPQADLICRVFALFVAFLLILRQIPEKFLTMVEEHAFLARVQCLESLFFIVISIAGLLLVPNPFVVLGVMAATKAVGTLFFVLPRLIRRCCRRSQWESCSFSSIIFCGGECLTSGCWFWEESPEY